MKPGTKISVTVIALGLMAAAQASARDQIRVVGSSTVFPFATAVAEQFGRTTDFQTPVVESTGSGGGLKLFCSGVGTDFPDVANSSRRMKQSEFDVCRSNGVDSITEVLMGFDGIVVANDKSGIPFELTREQIVIALAQNGPKPEYWNEVDPSLPPIKIEVLGPPPSSGTRDAFEELVMHEGCKETDLVDCDTVTVREDGAYVDAGENDNLIVSKLEANPNALGIFGFSFLDQNSDVIRAATIDGVEPEFDAIVDGDYPIARSLYFYIKNAHVGVVPGIAEYANAFMSDTAAGEDGYLIDKGLIPLEEDELEEIQDHVQELRPMDGTEWD